MPPATPLDGELAARCSRIDWLVLDVDGVLTDGGILLDDRGVETKQFQVRDGTALTAWRREGKRAAILSGRSAPLVELRAAELGIDPVIQGASRKGDALRALIADHQLDPAQVCYVGDDLADLAPLLLAGLAACPADAAPEVREVAHLVAGAPGGRGAVREVVEVILRCQGRWEAIVARFRDE